MIYRYTEPNGREAKCEIVVHRHQCRTLVIATEAGDNEGGSITNLAERLATDVCHKLDVSPHGLLWIEHYPPRGGNEESWDLVWFEFDWERRSFKAPRWNRLDSKGSARLLGLYQNLKKKEGAKV